MYLRSLVQRLSTLENGKGSSEHARLEVLYHRRVAVFLFKRLAVESSCDFQIYFTYYHRPGIDDQ